MSSSKFARSRRAFLRQLSALGLTWTTRRAFSQQGMDHAQQPMEQGPPPPIPMTMPMGSAEAMRTPAPKLPPMLRATSLTPFVDALPLPARAVPPDPAKPNKLRIPMREVHAKLHRDLPPARIWTYGDSALAPLIEARSGQPLEIEWVNNLPAKHFFPIDFSLHGCGRDLPEVRACVHLHGGRTPSADDGQPDDWFTAGQSRTCTYPLQQDATSLWYHDHAMGLNRLNIYAGLYGIALVRDSVEDALHLPSGKYEIPLMLADRMVTASGQLYYPDSGDPEHPWMPEFGGDALLVNGKLFPYLEVEPRLYRIRMVNAANSAFFNLTLSGDKPAAGANPAAGAYPFHQIGADQGLLPAPVPMTRLSIAPSERADLLIDFSGVAGANIHLRSGVVDILQFRVAKASVANVSVAKASVAQPAATMPATLRPFAAIPESAATVTRTIGLYEYLDVNANTMLMLINQKHWHEPVTETPKLNSTEIWQFVNTTEDTHPMHLHMVRFQVLDRRVVDVFGFRNNQGLRYLAPPIAPEPNEAAWKDVVQCPPGMVTRILVHFDGYPGRYLYHCHILEHEANDMMRPFEVLA